jgi:hypothetical protein
VATMMSKRGLAIILKVRLAAVLGCFRGPGRVFRAHPSRHDAARPDWTGVPASRLDIPNRVAVLGVAHIKPRHTRRGPAIISRTAHDRVKTM